MSMFWGVIVSEIYDFPKMETSSYQLAYLLAYNVSYIVKCAQMYYTAMVGCLSLVRNESASSI